MNYMVWNILSPNNTRCVSLFGIDEDIVIRFCEKCETAVRWGSKRQLKNRNRVRWGGGPKRRESGDQRAGTLDFLVS